MAQQPSANSPQRWEYSRALVTIGPELKGTLDELGKDGWELVSLQENERGHFSDHYHAIFKRPDLSNS